MAGPKLFLLYAPTDAEWAQSLYQRLHGDGYSIYMEPPESDPEDAVIQRKSAVALQKATHLLGVASKESTLGDSARDFEGWWRPFLQSGRPIITCVTPDAPPGTEHWMPFDLLRQRWADFRESDGYAQLQNLLGPAKGDANLAEAELDAIPLVSRVNVEARANRPESESRPIVTPRPIKPPKIKDPDENLPPISEADLPKPSPLRSIFNFIGVLIGLVLVILLLGAASQAVNSESGVSAEMWLLGVLGMVGALALIGRITYRRRRRKLRIEQRRKLAQERAKTTPTETAPARPEVYLEVIQSKAKDEIGQIWVVDDFALTIGRGAKVDVPLRDKRLAKRQCVVFYDDGEGRFYIENLDPHERTVFYDKPLLEGEVLPIENGDLILLGKSVVLQFRARG